MLSNPNFLKLSEALQRSNPQSLAEGMKIARGFADLGYEEFLLLPGQRILALYSGKITELPDDHAKFFFPVYSADDLAEQIVRAGYDIVSVEYREQRRWFGTFEDAGDRHRTSVSADTLELLFVTALTNDLAVKRVA